MLLHGLHRSWIGLRLRRFLAGGRLFSGILYVCYPGVRLLFDGRNNFRLAGVCFL
jgi:hypothetical protein